MKKTPTKKAKKTAPKKMAKKTAPKKMAPLPPVPTATNQAWRAHIDWVAAGKKAHETRMRNLAARAAELP